MMKTLCFAALLAGCLETSATPSESAVRNRYAFVESKLPAAEASSQTSRTNLATESALVPDDICSLLPTDGSCDAVCNGNALSATDIAVGTCGDFICTLTDGTLLRYGGCN